MVLAIGIGPATAQEPQPSGFANGARTVAQPRLAQGRWSAPVLVTPLLPFQCGSTEIAHVTLLPVDPLDGPQRRGKLLIITECEGNQAHVVDPEGTLLASYPSFPSGTQSMFCAAHTWVLRGPAKEPRFLVVGGLDETLFGKSCTGTLDACASKEAVLFDPLRSRWTHGPDLPERLWYPSVTLYRDTDGAFVPLVLGGTEIGGPRGCTLYDQAGMLSLLEDCSDPDDGVIDHQFQDWWSLPAPYTAWETHASADTGSTYWWHQYPRTLLRSDGTVFCAGHAIGCEDDIFSPVCEDEGQGSLGGNPIQIVEPRLSPQVRYEGPDPNLVEPLAGALNYCNATLSHTLRADAAFEAADPSSQYDLDRIVVVGGSTEAFTSNGMPALAQPAALELAADGQSWQRLADPLRPRVYGNLVQLPDGSQLYVGGQTSELYGAPGTSWSTAARLWLGAPGTAGRWEELAARLPATGATVATPRGYHSVAILLADGRVCLLGGRQISGQPLSTQTLELYEPPYLFRANRPSILQAPDALTYGSTHRIEVDEARRIERAVLLGIGSVTHHFDYGQRYVELLTRPVADDPSGRSLELRMPGATRRGAEMLPEGYYLLFVQARDGDGTVLPSEGAFVKVCARSFGPAQNAPPAVPR